jgi:hypothetical protein
LSVTCDRLVVFSRFFHQDNWPPLYNWNSIESGITRWGVEIWGSCRIKSLKISLRVIRRQTMQYPTGTKNKHYTANYDWAIRTTPIPGVKSGAPEGNVNVTRDHLMLYMYAVYSLIVTLNEIVLTYDDATEKFIYNIEKDFIIITFT